MMLNIVNIIFSAALFLNAVIFILQAVRFYTTKSSEGVSLLTFGGLLVIQLATVLHAVMVQDYILLIGYLLNIVTCGSVIILVLIFLGSHDFVIFRRSYNERA